MATVTDDNQTSQSLTFLQRVQDIPLVNDGLSNAHSLIQSNTYSAAVYNKAGEVASTVYSATEPYQKRFEPQIKQVDGVLNKGFDFVQSKIPYPFEAKTDEVIAKARAPADHVYIVASGYAKAANEKISPITEQIQAQVSKTLETIKPLQEKLQANLAAISSQSSQTASDAVAKVQATSNSIIAEVDNLLTYLKSSTQELPAHVQTSLQPFVEKLGTGYSDIKTEISKKDVPIATKAQNVLTYSKDNAIPLVNEALSSLKELVSPKSNEAGSKSGGISGPK